jgi:hypothetical protein
MQVTGSIHSGIAKDYREGPMGITSRLRFAKISVIAVFTLLLLFRPSILDAAPSADQDGDFSLVLFPDIQNYNLLGDEDVFLSQCGWVADNRERENIVAVCVLGDLSNNAFAEEYADDAKGFDIVEGAGVPLIPIIGNHDYKVAPRIGLRDAGKFDEFLASRGITGRPWYGGSYEGSNANYYAKLEHGSVKLLILALEFFPRTKVLDWASKVIDGNPGREVIVLTHGYLNADGTRTGIYDSYGPRAYYYADESQGQSGEELWKNLLGTKASIRAVICGHQLRGNSAFRADRGLHGNTVNQIFINYQSTAHGGDGWIGLLKIHPSAGRASFGAYRTWKASGLGFAPKTPESTGQLELDWPR